MGSQPFFPRSLSVGVADLGRSANVAIICLANIITRRLNNSKCKFLYFSIHFRCPQSLYYRTFSTFSHSQKTPNLQIIETKHLCCGGGTFFPVPPLKTPISTLHSPIPAFLISYPENQDQHAAVFRLLPPERSGKSKNTAK